MTSAAFSIDPHFRQQIEVMPAPDEGCMALVTQAALRVLNNKSGTPRLQPRAPMSKQSESNVRSHLSASLGLHPKTYGADMNQSTPVIPGTKREPNSQWLKDKIQIKRRVSAAVKEDHAHKHSYLKLVAREAGASPRTVEGWADATYLPGLEHFLRLVPRSPSIQKMLLQLMTFDPDHPEYARILNDLRGMAR